MRDPDHATIAPGRVYPLVDARCRHIRCDEPDVYRTVGDCANCHAGPFLVLVTAGHQMATGKKCPKCGCYDVRSLRLADDDELPEMALDGDGDA